MGKIIRIGPQKGPQERFLATSADICIYGGAAGGGKTFGLLLEPIRHMNNKNYNAVIFRSNYTQVTSPGGLWDSSGKIYKYYCVGISLGTPKFPLGYTVEQQCYSLAPKGYMLRMELEKFTEEYYRKLEGIGNDKIINMVMRFEAMAAAKGKELVFLCYEDVRIPEDWCHRTVFAQWYCEQTGEIIKELPDPNPPKVKKPPVQKQAKKEESKRTAAQKEAKTETEGYEQMSLFGMAGAMI